MSYKPGPQYLTLSEYTLGEKSKHPYPQDTKEKYGSFSISSAVRYPYNPSYFALAPQPFLAGVS